MEPKFLLSLIYVACHLGLFLAWFRRRSAFQQERGIILFHAESLLLWATILLTWFTFDPRETTFAGAVGGVSLHAIYSLSFLELWALSKTGFSLRILADIKRTGPQTIANIVRDNALLSDQKKVGRIQSLIALRLVRKTAGRYLLTARGRWIAAIIEGLTRLAGICEIG